MSTPSSTLCSPNQSSMHTLSAGTAGPLSGNGSGVFLSQKLLLSPFGTVWLQPMAKQMEAFTLTLRGLKVARRIYQSMKGCRDAYCFNLQVALHVSDLSI